jgi:imidazole glycerol phosphate synthase glutamine amidotransferase subunit
VSGGQRARVAILDYGAGNLRSVEKSLERAGADAFVTGDAATAREAVALVVPGVGHFGQCVRALREAGFEDLVGEAVEDGTPVLGVCVGMQILYAGSEEDPDAEGLGLLPGHVRRLPGDVRVPHMGWNTLHAVQDDPLLEGLEGRRCYFVHSFYADPEDDAHVIATTDYGPGFPSVVRVGNVVGTQFHPEKSAEVGRRLLENFVASLPTAA